VGGKRGPDKQVPRPTSSVIKKFYGDIKKSEPVRASKKRWETEQQRANRRWEDDGEKWFQKRNQWGGGRAVSINIGPIGYGPSSGNKGKTLKKKFILGAKPERTHKEGESKDYVCWGWRTVYLPKIVKAGNTELGVVWVSEWGN